MAIISGVPPKENYSLFFEDKKFYKNFRKQFKTVISNLVEQVEFQRDSEKLAIYKKRIAVRKDVGKKVKKLYPKIAEICENYVIDKKKELFLID